MGEDEGFPYFFPHLPYRPTFLPIYTCYRGLEHPGWHFLECSVIIMNICANLWQCLKSSEETENCLSKLKIIGSYLGLCKLDYCVVHFSVMFIEEISCKCPVNFQCTHQPIDTTKYQVMYNCLFQAKFWNKNGIYNYDGCCDVNSTSCQENVIKTTRWLSVLPSNWLFALWYWELVASWSWLIYLHW